MIAAWYAMAVRQTYPESYMDQVLFASGNHSRIKFTTPSESLIPIQRVFCVGYENDRIFRQLPSRHAWVVRIRCNRLQLDNFYL